MDIYVRYMEMPTSIKAITHKETDSYTICINPMLCQEEALRAYQHELSHINGNDFALSLPVDDIENLRHL